MNSQLTPSTHHTVQFLKDYRAEQARATHRPPWRHLAAIVGGAVVLITFAFFVTVAGDGQPGQPNGCYVDRYAQPADYSACSTATAGSSQALAPERR
jgi:hypothetical protein